jgi:hypothetical protein
MANHELRQHLGIAGEFLVAGELNRRWINASISFGQSKKADVFVYDSDKSKILRIEVKTTDKSKWPIGNKIVEEKNWIEDWFWVLVRLPTRPAVHHDRITDEIRGSNAPRYYVLTSTELGSIAKRKLDAYLEQYKKRHGREYSANLVHTVTIEDVETHEDAWKKIQNAFLFDHLGVA